MKPAFKYFAVFIVAVLPGIATAKDQTREKLVAAIADPHRPANEVARDSNRLPLQTLQFFGLKETMRVMDIGPGGGYYVPILALVLRDKGELFLAVGTQTVKKRLQQQPDYRHVKITSEKTTIHRPEGERFYKLGELDIDVTNLDMVTNFRMYHLFDDSDRQRLNRAIFKALKPGGVYAVIDHTARHGEAPTEANRRRFDPVKAIHEMQAAGFKFTDYSTLHAREQDNLLLEVGDKRVTGQTDRWVFKFTKPL